MHAVFTLACALFAHAHDLRYSEAAVPNRQGYGWNGPGTMYNWADANASNVECVSVDLGVCIALACVVYIFVFVFIVLLLCDNASDIPRPFFYAQGGEQ